MATVEGVEKIILFDSATNLDSFNKEHIEVGISLDKKFHYDDNTPNISLQRDSCSSAYILRDYVGKLFVPPSTGLVIESSKDIYGVVASPCAIIGSGNLNLILDEKYDLELCLLTNGPVIMNGKVHTCGSPTVGSVKLYQYGRDFDKFKEKYLLKSESLKSPLISTIEGCDNLIEANFDDHKIDFGIIDICMHYNLAFISKGGGSSNLYYIMPDMDTPEERAFVRTKNYIKRLDRKMDSMMAKYDGGDFDEIADIKKRMDDAKKKVSLIRNNINKRIIKFGKLDAQRSGGI